MGGQQVINDDFFLRGTGIDAISSRQIHNHDILVIVADITYLFIHSNARPVADFLPGSCQLIKNRRLAGIRIAGKCYR